jgi:hypothetical protein
MCESSIAYVEHCTLVLTSCFAAKGPMGLLIGFFFLVSLLRRAAYGAGPV